MYVILQLFFHTVVYSILVLYLEVSTGFGRSDVTKILASSKVGSRPCHFLMWARLPVNPSPDVAPLFSVKIVGKQNLNKHKLDDTMHRYVRKQDLVKGRYRDTVLECKSTFIQVL